MKPMSKIVRTVAASIGWFVFVFGIYVIVHGHLTPGGGFQGGAVMATGVALLIVAYGGWGAERCVGKERLPVFESAGLLTFIILAFGGACLGITFFFNFLANKGGLFGDKLPLGINPGIFNSAGVIPLMNMGVGMEVLAGISLILFAMFYGTKRVREGRCLVDNEEKEEDV
ncbi:MAG: sodium:proton antiporter [Synergistetes bacterium]|nr:sodium:proton antiporter [Synergistota bacterium]